LPPRRATIKTVVAARRAERGLNREAR